MITTTGVVRDTGVGDDGQGPRSGDRRQDGQSERRREDTRPEGQEDGTVGQVSDKLVLYFHDNIYTELPIIIRAYN